MQKTTIIIYFLLNLFLFNQINSFKYPELISSINTKLDPCDDFYKYVCDGFDKKNIPRSDCSEVSTTASRRAQIQKQLEDLLVNPPPLNTNLPEHLIKKLYGFHSACIQSSNKLTQGSEVILNKLNILTTKENGNKRQFNTEWAIKAFPIGVFFQLLPLFNTQKSRTNSLRKVFGIRPKTLISSSREWTINKTDDLLTSRYGMIIRNLIEDDIFYSLKQNIQPTLLPFNNNIFKREITQNCYQPNCQISTRLKGIINKEAERRVRNLFKIEQKLSQHFETDQIFETGPSSSQNYIPLSQLDTPEAFISSFSWTKFIQNVLSPIGININSETEIHLNEPTLLQRMGKIIEKFNEQEIADYLDWNILWNFMPQMDKRYTIHYVNSKPNNKAGEESSFGAKRCAMTKSWMTTNEKCEKFVEWYFPQIFDRIYLSKYLGNGIRTEIGKIYSSVYSEFKRMLENNLWLDKITKEKALSKLKKLQANAVYFEKIFDNKYLEGIYKAYNSLKTDIPFAEMVHNFEGAGFLRQMATNDYYDSSWIVNAYYSRETNALVALHGYLNPPIYSPDFLAVLNYAGIGVTLGHELSHAFDDWGSYYNGDGIMEDWLGPKMRAIFQERKQCFIKQYGNSKVQVDGVWLNLNGTLTVNENIADNGGLNAGFKAWQMLKRSSSSLDQNIFGTIEGIEQFNGDQLFFIHYAFRQCSKLGSTWFRQRLFSEPHSVVPARVNIPLQNSPHFSKAFGCSNGSPMNPIDKCSIW